MMGTKESFKLGDWIILNEENIEKMRMGYEDKDEFKRHYKYPRKIANIVHNSSSYPIYYMESSDRKMIAPKLYRLATENEIKIAKLAEMFQANINQGASQ